MIAEKKDNPNNFTIFLLKFFIYFVLYFNLFKI